MRVWKKLLRAPLCKHAIAPEQFKKREEKHLKSHDEISVHSFFPSPPLFSLLPPFFIPQAGTDSQGCELWRCSTGRTACLPLLMKEKNQLKIPLQTSETSRNSPHHWVYFMPCCFGGVQSRPLGQTTSPSSGLFFHPIVSPCAASSAINAEESKGSAPQMDPCACSLGRKKYPSLPPPPHTPAFM